MSSQITAAFVRQFGNNVMHLVQQKGSRLKPYVRNESLKGESGFFERIGASGPAAKKDFSSRRHSTNGYSTLKTYGYRFYLSPC